MYSCAIQWKAIADSRFVANHFTCQTCGAEFSEKMGEVDAEVAGLFPPALLLHTALRWWTRMKPLPTWRVGEFSG
jgi:hypothetical protein